MRKFISSALVLAFGLILVYHFILFWVEGSVIIGEPNKIVLLGETLISVVIIAFGVEGLVRS